MHHDAHKIIMLHTIANLKSQQLEFSQSNDFSQINKFFVRRVYYSFVVFMKTD